MESDYSITVLWDIWSIPETLVVSAILCGAGLLGRKIIKHLDNLLRRDEA
jgi:hypothetical protein